MNGHEIAHTVLFNALIMAAMFAVLYLIHLIPELVLNWLGLN